MIAATGWDLLQGNSPQQGRRRCRIAAAHVVMNQERWIVLIIGTVVSFIVALGVVEWFLYLGAQARLYHLCHLPHSARRRAADLGREAGSAG